MPKAFYQPKAAVPLWKEQALSMTADKKEAEEDLKRNLDQAGKKEK